MPRPNPRHRINLPKPNERLENLVVARESDSHDIPLLEGMIMQTLERLPDLPGRDTLRGLGVRPVTHPHEVGGRVRKKLGSTAVFFAVEGTACLYSRGSAAKDENIERENGFVLLLCEVLKEHKPRNVYVATFSRLVRSIYHSGPVRSALEEAGSRLHYDGGSIDFAEDGEADLKWAVMAAFAAMERRAVLTRLMLGRCARHRRNKWIYQPRTVPMGYKLVRGRIKVDEDARQAVAKAIRLMGDPDVSSRELALALGAIGVLTPQRGDRKWTYSNWAWNGEPYVPLRLRPRDGNGQPSFDFNEGYVRADYIDGPSEFSADDDPHDLDDDPHDLDAELQALTGEEDYDGSGSGPATDGGFSQGNLTGDWAGRDGELGLGLDDGLQDFEDELIDDEATPAGFDELGEFGGVGGLDDFDDDENPDDDDDESDDDTDIDIEGPDSTTPETAARSEAGVPAPTTDSGARAPRRRRDHKRDLGDFASPDRIGRRIIELLDLWQHGTITLELASPLPNVKKYAEYDVKEDNGRHYIEFNYAPGVPDGGWATDEDFELARAGRRARVRTPGQNSHAGRTQLPLLGDLGRWNEGGYRYGLLSGRAGTGETRIHRYELRKLTLPKDIPRHRNGQPDYPGFYFQGASAGERVASFDAAELHTAISRALTEALENGVPMEPHHTMAPSSIFTHTPERLDELRAESYRLHTLANQARHEYYASVDNPDLSPESRMRFLADSDQFSAEASAVDAQIAEAETVGTSRMKDRLSTRPELLADVLAGLAETNGPVPRDVTIAVNHVLSDLRITISGLYADCTIRAHLPVEDGVMTLGPIPFRVRQRIPENRAARSTLGTETEAAKEHLHAVAEAAFNTDRPLAAIGDSQTRTGHHQRLRVIDYLTTIGLKRASAHVALDCEVLTTRQTIWALLTDQPTPQGLDPAYVQRIHDTFITNAANLRRWYRDTGARALFTAYLRENGGHATMIDVREWLPHQGYEASSYAMLFSPSTSRSSSPLVEHMWATALRPRQAEGSSACTEACPKFCWDHNLARLRTCPHCYSNVDYHIPVPEIPTGLLCGNCLREPLPGAQAPRFPAEYLNVTGQTARERATAVNPSALAGNRLIADGKAVNGNARRWAIAAGLIVDDPAANLDDAIIDRYIIEITRGQVHHQPTIRRWARKNGYKVGHRGQMSPAVISAYRRDIAVNDPAILREWAQQNGLDPDAPDTLEAFAAVRP